MLNLIFVIGFRLSVYGVAAASVISQYVSAVLILRALFRSNEVHSLRWQELKLTEKRAARILQLGLPAGFQGIIFCIANLFVQVGVNSFSATVVAGNAAAANADNLIYDIMAAFYTACASFMGQNLGAGKKDRVWKSYWYSMLYAFLIALLLGILLVLFGYQFLYLFADEAEVVEAGMERLAIMGFCYCVSAFMDCTIAASRALGKTLMPTLIVILGSCVFRIVWVYTVFASFQTTTSLYLLYICSWTLTSIAEMIYFFWSSRKVVREVQGISHTECPL